MNNMTKLMAFMVVAPSYLLINFSHTPLFTRTLGIAPGEQQVEVRSESDDSMRSVIQTEPARIRAFLDTIAWAEGTFEEDGYRKMYTNKYFKSFDKHPGKIHYGIINGRRVGSTAAGRGQFLESTWNRLQEKHGFEDFNPLNQDKAMVALLKEAGAYELILSGSIDDLHKAILRSGKIWAGLPGNDYNQNPKMLPDVLANYQENLKYYGGK